VHEGRSLSQISGPRASAVVVKFYLGDAKNLTTFLGS
jgi:hypothetical protein